MIRKIKGKYFVDSIKEEVIVERKLEKPLPVEIEGNFMVTKGPPCCICGGIEKRDIAICCVGADSWERWICPSCVEEHMPDLMPILEKRIKERYLELGFSE